VESRGRTYRKTWRWIQLAIELKATLPRVCTICNRYLDPDLHPNHKHAATVDHITELQDGGDPYDPSNLTLVCRSCNSSKGNRNQRRRRQDQFRAKARARELNPSRAW
jgi:5-methylcytosine-specific restriction endonuclease McrA